MKDFDCHSGTKSLRNVMEEGRKERAAEDGFTPRLRTDISQAEESSMYKANVL
jgi:hypothetical protein